MLNKAYDMSNDSRISLYIRVMDILDYYDENITIERKLNCYVVNIPKEVVEKTNLKDEDLKISSKDNKIIIEKLEKGE